MITRKVAPVLMSKGTKYRLLFSFPSLQEMVECVFQKRSRTRVLSPFSLVWLCDSMDRSPPGSAVHEIFQAKNTGVGCHGLLQDIFRHPGIEPKSPGSPALQADSLLTESPGKPQKWLDKSKKKKIWTSSKWTLGFPQFGKESRSRWNARVKAFARKEWSIHH